MANPQCEDGYVRIANEIIDALIKINLSSYEWRILLAIIRKTYGWNKKKDRISLSQFAKITGIRKSHISRTLSKLVEKNIVTRTGNVTHSGNQRNITYSFQKNYEEWKALPKQVTLPKQVKRVTYLGKKRLPKQVTTKDNIQKTILQKTNNIYIHKRKIIENIIKKWNQFAEENDLPIVKKLSDRRKKHLLKRLKEKEFNFDEILNQIKKSKFLLGENDNGWRVTFDWIIQNNDNYIKILEGKYSPKEYNFDSGKKYISPSTQWALRTLKEIEELEKKCQRK